MFEDSVLETRMAHRRRWTTFVSFVLECVGICVLVLIPLIYTEALPNLNMAARISAPNPPAPPKPIQVVSTQREETPTQSEFVNNVLVAPREIPHTIKDIVDKVAPAQAPNPTNFGVEGGTGTGENNPVISELLRPHTTVIPTVAPPRVVRISTIDPGQIIRRVQPVYPAIARSTRTQGAVVLEALIDRDGRIENLKFVSGHPLLIASAMEAVRQWRYRPYLLNGVPVEVQTTVTVNFILSQN